MAGTVVRWRRGHWPNVGQLSFSSSYSERYVLNAPLLRSRFRLSVCDAHELCVNIGTIVKSVYTMWPWI